MVISVSPFPVAPERLLLHNALTTHAGEGDAKTAPSSLQYRTDMSEQATAISSDLTFITNEPGKTLRDRFAVLLAKDTRFFDCLVGYFFVSGFYKLYPH